MTGAYLRVQRDGKYQNVEIEYLLDREREELFKESSTEEVLKWLNFMCNQYEELVLAMINKFGGSDELLFDEENKEERMSEEVIELPKPILIEDLGMLYPTEKSKTKERYGLYKCGFCGTEFRTQISLVKCGNTKSCGCYNRRRASETHKTHGLIGTRLYNIWTNMKNRTLNPKNTSYLDYGGRGITICDEWKNDFMSFYGWAMSNGYSDELSIDRIDTDGNYCTENCRWVTRVIQGRNQRIQKNNTSGYRGVSYNKRKGKYQTYIKIKSKKIHLGMFSTAEEGAIAYNNYIIENNLEGFNLNEIPEDYLNQIKKEERIEKSFINR